MPVIDASVAVKFVVAEDGTADAAALLRSSEPLIAPDWLLVEVGHALWKKAQSGFIAPAVAVEALEAMPKFFEELYPTPELLQRAYTLAFDLNHWLYDCLYLELARQEDTVVVTADRKFKNAASGCGHGGRVVLLGAGA
jgi:predicted nucleic acid-binding protein